MDRDVIEKMQENLPEREQLDAQFEEANGELEQLSERQRAELVYDLACFIRSHPDAPIRKGMMEALSTTLEIGALAAGSLATGQAVIAPSPNVVPDMNSVLLLGAAGLAKYSADWFQWIGNSPIGRLIESAECLADDMARGWPLPAGYSEESLAAGWTNGDPYAPQAKLTMDTANYIHEQGLLRSKLQRKYGTAIQSLCLVAAMGAGGDLWYNADAAHNGRDAQERKIHQQADMAILATLGLGAVYARATRNRYSPIVSINDLVKQANELSKGLAAEGGKTQYYYNAASPLLSADDIEQKGKVRDTRNEREPE